MVALLVQFHLFCLSVLWIQRTVVQEVDAMREAQLPALSVGFKVHQQGLTGTAWEQCMKGSRNVKTHKGPTRGLTYIIPASKREVAAISSK